MVSNGASVSLPELLEERAELAKKDADKPVTFWWQIYLRRERAINESQIKQAVEGKVDAIVITVDAVALGNHEKNQAHPERMLVANDPDKVQVRGLTPVAMGTLERELAFEAY